MAGRLDPTAAARVLRLLDAQLELVAAGYADTAQMVIDLDAVTSFERGGLASLRHAPYTAARRSITVSLSGYGARLHLLPLHARQLLAEFDTFPTLEAATHALIPIPSPGPGTAPDDGGHPVTNPERHPWAAGSQRAPGDDACGGTGERAPRRQRAGSSQAGLMTATSGPNLPAIAPASPPTRHPGPAHAQAADLSRVVDHPSGPGRTGTPRAPAPAATIWVIDDHQLVASSLAGSLRVAGHDARTHPIRSTKELLAATRLITSGLVLLDLELGRDPAGHRIDAVALVQPLRASGWQVLALADNTPTERVGAALAAGAAGAIPKTAPLTTLLAALRDALTGRPVHPEAQRRDLIDHHHRHQHEHHHLHAAFSALTDREHEILDLLAAGRRAQAIATHYTVSVATVRTQIRGVLTKLGVHSQLEAVALYSRHHRPEPDYSPLHTGGSPAEAP
ncbi:LuxR C-terminal-related transcriptional regulator [Pseudonocardia parietis]|uniref:DNA-binding NarL/FixJ family response regulator n=1 Tax=Pseudonocardia parietis TaxID=570936 RepID=A0ABS4VS56_9PSEU|nr:LuxR C-terminal-related transcriptional regulator [Pseudonocardia parietis]MBP2366768.1 DNA-binding NarL/FixJ family response regulator [Pseudonocardia parietis]